METVTHTQRAHAGERVHTTWAALTEEDFRDMVTTVNAYHDVIRITSEGDLWRVATLDTNGFVASSEVASNEEVQEQIITFAINTGWFWVEGPDTEAPIHYIDLKMFDAWNIAYCFDVAAFGEDH